MFFVFGGGFTRGERDNAFYNPYYTALAENGITVIAIDYRLGMKNRKGFSIFNTEPMDNAIQMGVEDLFEATNFVIRQAEQFNIDTEMMMISGSSAGAIICLHADYIKRNNFQGSEILPPDFQYKGVLSFAGAILSHKGTPDYITPPAPTLFFHGDKDKLVVYNKLRFFRLGLFGSASIAKRFNKRGFSYCFYTVKDMSHSIATLPLQNYTDQILFFIEEYIYRQKPWQMNILLKDNSLKPDKTTTIKQMYN
jgi:predicted esterase